MEIIEIFDPAMCCETGVCGPGIDPELMRVATTISSLKEKGIQIKRHGLSNEPLAFINNKVINDILQKDGVEVLPVTLLNGVIAKIKTYPTSEEFSEWLGVKINIVENKNGCCDCGTGCY
jgi:hypothetical protein